MTEAAGSRSTAERRLQRLDSRIQKMDTAMLLFSAPNQVLMTPMKTIANNTISADRATMASRSFRTVSGAASARSFRLDAGSSCII